MEFISSFNDHSDKSGKLTKATDSIAEKDRSYRGLKAIGRGEYMTFRMQGKDIYQHLENISPSAMSRIIKRLRLHEIIERV